VWTADHIVNSASPRAATPGSLCGVLCTVLCIGAAWGLRNGQWVCVCFITAGPITKLCAWGEEESGGGRRRGPTLSCPGIYVKSSLFVKEVFVKKILFVRKVVKTAFKLIKPDLVFSKSPLFTQENRDSRGLKIVYYFLLSVRTAGNTLYVFVEYVMSAPSSCP